MGLEPLFAYPHILEAIRATWGYPECGNYLDKLLVQERGDKRQGLELHALETLGVLQALHHFLYPQVLRGKQDMWGRDGEARL